MAETRGPGRPRAIRINRFSTLTDLELDERFVTFRKITGVSEGQALLSIITLYKYAARHRAIDGSLAKIPPETLVERCYWLIDSPVSDPNTFIQALIQAEFLDQDLNIIDWFDLQPHAKKYAQKLKEQ